MLTLAAAGGSSSTQEAKASDAEATPPALDFSADVFPFERNASLPRVQATATALPVIILPGFGERPTAASQPQTSFRAACITVL